MKCSKRIFWILALSVVTLISLTTGCAFSSNVDTHPGSFRWKLATGRFNTALECPHIHLLRQARPATSISRATRTTMRVLMTRMFPVTLCTT